MRSLAEDMRVRVTAHVDGIRIARLLGEIKPRTCAPITHARSQARAGVGARHQKLTIEAIPRASRVGPDLMREDCRRRRAARAVPQPVLVALAAALEGDVASLHPVVAELEAVLPALLNLALAASERIFLAFPTAAETGHGSPQVDASRRTRVHIVCFGTRVPKLTV